MKTKIVLASVLIALFSFTGANTRSAHNSKALKKNPPAKAHILKGLAMEDRDQFSRLR